MKRDEFKRGGRVERAVASFKGIFPAKVNEKRVYTIQNELQKIYFLPMIAPCQKSRSAARNNHRLIFFLRNTW